MSKPDYKQPARFIAPPYVPPRKPNEEDIQILFLLAQGGDFNKIKTFVMQNNATYRIKNKDEQTIVHVIVDNSELSDNQTYELVKYLLERGAPSAEYDKNNITPLHLACKHQLTNIVKIL